MRKIVCDACERIVKHGESFLSMDATEFVAREGRSSCRKADSAGQRIAVIEFCIECLKKPLILAEVVGKRMRDLDDVERELTEDLPRPLGMGSS